jgi:hypothetical protein
MTSLPNHGNKDKLKITVVRDADSVDRCYIFGGNPCLKFEGRNSGDVEGGVSRILLNFVIRKIEVSGSSEKVVPLYKTTRLDVPEIRYFETRFPKNMNTFVTYF